VWAVTVVRVGRMAETQPTELTAEQKAKRAASFGAAADHYERYRPGPPLEAVEWILPEGARTVVDLGAGTGALSRLLVDRVDEVIAVEPDARMRSVLTDALPGVRAVEGRGESMPLPDASADAVIASSSWHWVDPVPGLHEVGRVLVPGGVLGAIWSGPDRDAAFFAQAQALLSGGSSDTGGSGGSGGGGESILDEQSRAELSAAVNDPTATTQALEIPTGVPFEQPEHTELKWDVALNAEELVGLLGTFSWVILMEDDARARLSGAARRALRDMLGVDGDATVDVGYRADVWRARRQA
jgi:SAM-dependent methyltransferase